MVKGKASSKDRLKKAQVIFYPEKADYEALKELSTEKGRPQQEFLREGLKLVFEKYEWKRERTATGGRHTLVPKKKKVAQS